MCLKKFDIGHCLLGGGRIFRDGLGPFGDCVLGKFTREDESDRGLDLTGGDGGLLVVGSKLGGLGSNTLEDVIDEGVQNGHGTVGDTGVRVNLLEDLIDIRGVGLLPGLGSLLLVAWGSSGLLSSLLWLVRSWGFASWGLSAGGGLLLSSFRGHFVMISG